VSPDVSRVARCLFCRCPSPGEPPELVTIPFFPLRLLSPFLFASLLLLPSPWQRLTLVRELPPIVSSRRSFFSPVSGPPPLPRVEILDDGIAFMPRTGSFSPFPLPIPCRVFAGGSSFFVLLALLFLPVGKFSGAKETPVFTANRR